MANYPQELAQDAVFQSHTGHMTGLWFLPARPLRLNTDEGMNYYTQRGWQISELSRLLHCAAPLRPLCINRLYNPGTTHPAVKHI